MRANPARCRILRQPATACLLAALSMLAACGGGPEVLNEPYRGPAPLTVEPVNGLHSVVAETPSPGWSLEFDGSERRADGMLARVTLRRPDPQFLYAAQVVRQQVLTDVPAETPIRVVARVVDHNAGQQAGDYRPLP